MGSCSAINTMYGGKKSRRSRMSRRYRKMRGGYVDENGNIIERSADAITGTAIGTAEVVKENVGEVLSEGSSMLSKLGGIFANAGEKIKEAVVGKEEPSTFGEKLSNSFSKTGETLKETSKNLYESVIGESDEENGGMFSGGRRRRHKSRKHKMMGGRRHRKTKRYNVKKNKSSRKKSRRNKRRSGRRY
jgi:hypothetical protein